MRTTFRKHPAAVEASVRRHLVRFDREHRPKLLAADAADARCADHARLADAEQRLATFGPYTQGWSRAFHDREQAIGAQLERRAQIATAGR